MTRRGWYRQVGRTARGLGAALVLSQAALAGAQSESEIASASAQLRQLSAALEPLPESPITRDIGEIAVIAHDGSSYDRIHEAQPNYVARERVGRRFYETHADEYDFLVVFTNFEFETGGATAFHLYGRNDVLGIGKSVGAVAPVVFGSPARLKGWVDMASVARYRQRPLSLTLGDPGFLRTLNVLAHEMGHQWLADARYKVGDSIFDDLLGQDDAHWSYLLDSDASFFYGARWRDNADGSFTAAAVGERYSALDLYLMGLLPKDKVPPLRLLRNPAVDRHRVNREGEVLAATETTEIQIQQLIDAMGQRRPDSVHSQKEFRLGFVFLTAPGTEPTAEDLEAVEWIRSAFGTHFFALTSGVGWADTTLGAATPVAHAATPDVDRALAWLGAQQRLDGSWSDAPETQARDTAAAASALLRAGATGPAWQRGLSWLQQAQPESLDFRARTGSALSEAGLTTGARALLAAGLLQAQNADGGFGAGRDFASDALDSALALRALAAMSYPADDRVRRAVAGLAGLVSPDGGWPAVPGGETSTVVTAEVLLALLDWKDVPGSAALRATGLAALLARRNPDGGFGSSPSTPQASALALEVLLTAGAGTELVDPLVAWLEREQLADGSWAASPYQTALVVSALRRSAGANLVVPAATLSVAPNPAREGDPVRVTARVRNAGRTAAAASVARLYDGDPASSAALAESPVPALAAGADAEVSFDYATRDRPGQRTLYVVADAARQVRESREDDNTASRALTVEGLLADLFVAGPSIAIVPAGPEVGEAVAIHVAVQNRGARAAPKSLLAIGITDFLGQESRPPLTEVPALQPGETATVAIPWTPAAAGPHSIRARADADYRVPESDETNGMAERTVEVFEVAPSGPELAVGVALSADTLVELPQPLQVFATVENAGRSGASTSVAVFDAYRQGPVLGSTTVDVGARSSTSVQIPVEIASRGTRPLVVVVDPDDQIAESNEENNVANAALRDAETSDLEMLAVSASPPEVEVGETLTVRAVIRNRGTLDAMQVPVQLLRTGGSIGELARSVVSLAAGQSTTVSIRWTPAVAQDDLRLRVLVDPFDLLQETREENNSAELTARVRPSGLPNLTVSGAELTITPDPPIEGQAATVSAVVRNRGGVRAGPFSVRFFAGDPDFEGRLIGQSVLDLEAGGDATASIEWSPVDVRGAVGLYVVADALHEVAESIETDNRAFHAFSAVGLPDLVLSLADVVLEPGYPRLGEAVSIRAAVRNLGDRPSAETALVVTEGEPDVAVVGTLTIPGLVPGASSIVSLAWTPASALGAHVLRFSVDPEDVVVEHDEGNNEVRRTVVVQDPDLYLTEPFFSPNGDGVKDDTTLAWRSEFPAEVVVSDSRGRAVRTLAAASRSASATWDGRDERGLIVPDGAYSLSLLGTDRRVLGRAEAVVDTNRSALHHALLGRTTLRNLTCTLPALLDGPAWMPAEDEVLYVVQRAEPGFPLGLLRVGLDGGFGYVAQDDWYGQARVASAAAVSPDGREVLVIANGALIAVDLATGARRPIAPAAPRVAWSPDGRFILNGSTVLARDGSAEGELGGGDWACSPGSDRLASVSAGGDAVVIVARDGTPVDTIPLDREHGEETAAYSLGAVWRGDGRIVASVGFCVDDGYEGACDDASFLIDPESRVARRLPFSVAPAWWAGQEWQAAWSPDGTRVLLPSGELRLESGTSFGRLMPYGSSYGGFAVSPRGTVAIFDQFASDTGPGTLVCPGKGGDTLVFGGLANLVTMLEVARLPGATGLVLRGTVGDLNLDHFQIDFADRGDPTLWHPIGAASDLPVVDDQLALWVPPGPGTYVLRLTVVDRAGNSRVLTRLVPWERVPALTSFTQSDRLISPNGDGVKDEVRIRYTSLLPTHVDVRILGPDPERPGAPAAREVWRSVIEHPHPGPQAFVWNGRDASDELVPDGWYTVFINALPFRVEIDNTPPEIGLELGHPEAGLAAVGVDKRTEGGDPVCEPTGPSPLPPTLPLATVVATQSLYVVDRNLVRWSSPWQTTYNAYEPVFVPDTDESGSTLLEGGRPRVRREGGRPVGREDLVFVGESYPASRKLLLKARDHAGNVAVLEVEPPREAAVPLGAIARCQALAAPLEAEASPGAPVNALAPEKLYLQVGSTPHHDSNERAKLEIQPVRGGDWREVGRPTGGGALTTFRIDSFEALGLDPTAIFRGRFRARGAVEELVSPPFAFCPCKGRLKAELASDGPRSYVVLRGRLASPIAKARALLELLPLGAPPLSLPPLTLQPLSADEASRRFGLTTFEGEELLFAALPPLDLNCTRRLSVSVQVQDAAGKRYPSDEIERACQKLELQFPASCQAALDLSQVFSHCKATPGVISVAASGYAEVPVLVAIEGGPKEAPVPIDTFEFRPMDGKNSFERKYEIPVGDVSEESYPLRGRLRSLEPGLAFATDDLLAIVDRQPPTGEILVPAEGATACLAAGRAGPELGTLVRFTDDKSAVVSAPEASWRFPGGGWQPLQLVCDKGPCPSVASTGGVLGLDWSAPQLDNGWHDVRLDFCDGSGNAGSTTRRVLVTRDPPKLQVRSVAPRVFSPNGDGRQESTLATVRLRETGVLTARVHAAAATGAVVRTLFFEQPQATTEAAAFWDGRDDAGERVPDGSYAIVFTAADACGGEGRASAGVEADTQPPEVAITDPAAGQRVSATVEVRGQAADPHFGTWDLEAACGTDPWSKLASARSPVSAGGFLGRWDTSRAPPGECRLRLTAEDEAGNRSPEAVVTVHVERGELLLRLAASPGVFSPNGDGRRETAALEYELARSARVWLQVRDGDGRVIRTFETAAEHGADGFSHLWDGKNDARQPAPEGDHLLWIRAEDPAVATVYEERTVRLALDRTPPSIALARPARDGFAPSQAMVHGSVTDTHLAEYRITATPAGGAPVELAHAFQGRTDADLAVLGPLAEGPHTLLVVASDLGENEAQVEVAFVVDSTPPRAAIQSPFNGVFLRKGDAPIPVTGLVGDDHLEGWTLRFGAGTEPPVFVTVAQGSTGGNGIPLGGWDVRYVPDGVYTLSLVATDLAGLVTESRVAVTLDGQPPKAAISDPVESGYVKEPVPIQGSAADANLASWTLEAAPGNAATAYQWAPIAEGKAAIDAGTLGDLSPLPPDGVYTLRLTARDKVELTASTHVTVTVDTTPPAAPTGLASTIAKGREGHGNVRITWNPNSEPDLDGYRISRDAADLVGTSFPDPARDDPDRIEGRYLYSVVAVDRAGNASPPSKLTVRVDLTPPLVSFASPAAGASVVGSVDVRGTAYSADDFAEYRLYVGAGAEPAAWTLLRTSSVAVASGRLGEWLALADGPHVLALEADDTTGNRGRVTRAVLVDTQPPEPPVLVEVSRPPTPVDRLVPTWQPSPSSDVAGYLVYRNGRLAGTDQIVLGDLRGFLVTGPMQPEDGLPDGKHCYHVVAMDGAGNESVPSNEICRSLDNRAPRAIVVEPADGTRFGYPVRVVAYTPDLDVASVRFQIRVSGAGGWNDLGALLIAAPWETTLDPAPLSPGTYELRAVATDEVDHTDPDPAAITVVYGDTTPPPPLASLVAHVTGANVALAWTPSAAADFASYRVYRDGLRIAEGLTDPQSADPGLSLGSYSYAVTAVDDDGNESIPSAPAEAVVYALRLDEPAWPVVPAASASVEGSGSRPATTVGVLRDGSPVAAGPAAGGRFRVDGVPLLEDGNLLRARGEDAMGNRSIPSDEIVLIANGQPAGVADLAATVDGRRVTLAWTPVADADLFGYVVRRDGERLTDSVAQTTASAFEATLAPDWARLAFDGNPTTTWPEGASTGEWTVHFASPVLVERIRLRFAAPEAGAPEDPRRYTILARWQDRYLPIVRARDVARLASDHLLPAPFATTALRVVLESPARLAEVAIDRLDVVPAGTSEFREDPAPEGRHSFEVAAIDFYGALGTAGSVAVAVGDVDPPAPPVGLVATPIGREVQLTWNASPEPDVVGYVVLRGGVRIGTTPAPGYRDRKLPNGSYVYTVIAADASGLESAESAPATALIDVQPVPPAAPVILEPTDAAHPITLEASRTDVAGRAETGSIVSLEVNGEPGGRAPAEPGFEPVSSELVPGSPLALSPDGRLMAWAASDDSVGVRGLPGGDRSLPAGATLVSGSLLFSPDASQLAFSRRAGVSSTEVGLLSLPDGAVRVLLEGEPVAIAWSPDGRRLALSLRDTVGTVLEVVDVASGERRELDRSPGVDQHLRWSPDGSRLACLRYWGGGTAELRVLEVGSRDSVVLDEEPWPDAPPAWSPDGRRLAWTSAERTPLFIRVYELEAARVSAEIAEPGADAKDARFSPAGDWLSYVRVQPVAGGASLASLRAREEATGLAVTVVHAQPEWTRPDAHDWAGAELVLQAVGRLQRFAPAAGRFVVRDVALRPGENRLVARATDPATQLTSSASDAVTVHVAPDAFPDLVVEASDIRCVPTLPAIGRPARIFVRVRNLGALDSGETDVALRVGDPDGLSVLDTSAPLSGVPAGSSTWLSLPWTPAIVGDHRVSVAVDSADRLAEASEDNNLAEQTLLVVPGEGLTAAIASDRLLYAASVPVSVTVRLDNPGRPFEGVARTTVEEPGGGEVALVDERPVSLDYGGSLELALAWNTGTNRAARYALRVRVRAAGETLPSASAERVFDIEPGLSVLARVRPQPVTVAEGAPARFALSVDNRSTNAVLEGALARLRLQLEGTSGLATFETVRALPSLLPGGTWEALDSWPSARPAGRYAVRFEVEKAGAVLATASAVLTIAPAVPVVAGTLAVVPGDVLAGEEAVAHLRLENRGTAGVAGYPLLVDVVAGPEATLHASMPSSVDLAAGESRPLTVEIATSAIPAGPYTVRLRGGASPVTLDSTSLVVHGLIGPPSPHAPVGGGRVSTNHPLLVVNNAAAPAGVALRYEFELFGDEALTQALPGARGVTETEPRTAWPVAAGLAEDTPYWWRARASDGFSTSAWSAVASFTVDVVNLPPTAPVPDTPAPDARVASRQPALTVRNAVDPERQPLAYEFRLAVDEDMRGIVTAQAGIAEGLGFTAWTVTATLDEDALYYWSARARTSGDAPEDFSPWSVPVAFRVDTFNGAPTAPRPLRPTGGADVSSPTPALVVANASDPEGDALTYRFEIDTQPTLDSPARQASAELAPGLDETAWTPPLPLDENTRYYWRAHASDGNTATPSVLASFFVDSVNEAPGAPKLLDPVDGRVVSTATPTLRLRNALDPEADVLVYEFAVRAADGTVVAAASGIPAGPDETTWTVEPALPEDQAFTWSARASDGELFGPWSAPARFRVDAVVEPPTAPVPRLPAEGSVVGERRPALAVDNATSPDGLTLGYTFELEAVAADDSVTLVERVEGVAEGLETTAFTPSVDLADGSYQWRARASDPHQKGEWSSTAHFSVLVDPPPATPTGLRAMAGDATVHLEWNASPEPDVIGYRVYRATASGGPYTRVAAVAAPSRLDTGLTNGVTYYYVVTARDARAESLPSNEAAARPESPQALVAEVRYDPSVIRGECLLARDDDDGDDDDDHDSGHQAGQREHEGGSCARRCPEWLLATIELPAGHDPRTIETASLRLFGAVSADPRRREIVDTDRDHIPELRVRFRFDAVASHLSAGANTATIAGRAAGSELRGSARIDVLPIEAELRVAPRTLRRRSSGQAVQARITFGEGVEAAQVAIGSVRLNGVVAVERVVERHDHVLVLKFDRAAVSRVLPLGASVELRVTGTLARLPFAAVDHIRVIE